MTRMINIPEHEEFFKTLKLSLHEFSSEHNVSTNEYFANKLHFKGDNKAQQFNALLNINTGKDLKVREFITLCDFLGTDFVKPILDYLSKRYNYVCSKNINSNNAKIENIKDSLLLSTVLNADFINKFVSSSADNVLDEDEINEMLDCSYTLRQHLISIENSLKAKKSN